MADKKISALTGAITSLAGTEVLPIAVGVSFQYDGDLTKIRFIQQSASGILNISYYR